MEIILMIVYVCILLIFFIRIQKLTKENNELRKIINNPCEALLPLLENKIRNEEQK